MVDRAPAKQAAQGRRRPATSAHQTAPLNVESKGAPALILWMLAFAVFSIVFVTFIPALSNGFVDWDDTDNFLRNTNYRGLGLQNIKWMFTTFYMGHYQPLTWLTLGCDAVCGEALFQNRLDPRPYHLTNNLLHSVNAVLVFLIALRLLAWRVPGDHARKRWAAPAGAAVAAVIFGVHPLRVESVAWLTERRDLLSGLFILLTVLSYLRANRPGQAHRSRWMGITLGFFVLSLLSKVIGVTLPVVLLLLDWFPLARLERSPRTWLAPRVRIVWLEKIPFLALSLIFSSIASIGQGSHKWLVPLSQHGPIARIFQSCYGLIFYLWKTLLPIDLLPLYERHDPMNVQEPRYIAAMVLVPCFAITVLWLLVRRRWPGLVVATLAYVFMLGPVLGIVQNGPQIVADRYSYLPCIGWAILIGAGFAWLWRRPEGSIRFGAAALALGCVATLSTLSWKQTLVWRDTASLWTYMWQKDPESSYAQNGYGYVLLTQQKHQPAIEHLQRSLQILPTNLNARTNLARAHYEIGTNRLKESDPSEALRELEMAVQLDPKHAKALTNLGLALVRLGKREEAVDKYERAIQADPNLFEAHYNLGLDLLALGRMNDAIEQLRIAVQLNPNHAEAKSTLNQLVQQSR